MKYLLYEIPSQDAYLTKINKIINNKLNGYCFGISLLWVLYKCYDASYPDKMPSNATNIFKECFRKEFTLILKDISNSENLEMHANFIELTAGLQVRQAVKHLLLQELALDYISSHVIYSSSKDPKGLIVSFQEMLQRCLVHLVPGQAVLISSEYHAMAIFRKTKGIYTYFDPNNPYIIDFLNLEDLADSITASLISLLPVYGELPFILNVGLEVYSLGKCTELEQLIQHINVYTVSLPKVQQLIADYRARHRPVVSVVNSLIKELVFKDTILPEYSFLDSAKLSNIVKCLLDIHFSLNYSYRDDNLHLTKKEWDYFYVPAVIYARQSNNFALLEQCLKDKSMNKVLLNCPHFLVETFQDTTYKRLRFLLKDKYLELMSIATLEKFLQKAEQPNLFFAKCCIIDAIERKKRSMGISPAKYSC